MNVGNVRNVENVGNVGNVVVVVFQFYKFEDLKGRTAHKEFELAEAAFEEGRHDR